MSTQFEMGNLDKRKDKAKIARLKNQLETLRIIERYIESNPDAEYIRGSLQKLEKKLDIIMQGEVLFKNNHGISDAHNPESKKLLKKYHDDCGVPVIKKQIRALRYIIN